MNQNLGKLIQLKKLCTDNSHFQMLAVDQRPPIFNIIASAKGRKHSYEEVLECKKLNTSNHSHLATAILIDPHYSIPNLLQHNNSKGLVITLEEHDFKETLHGRYSSDIDNWSVEKIKKAGGDAVKVLAWYRPDAEKKSLEYQQKYVQRIGEECEKYSIPFLLELLVYPFQDDVHHTKDYKEQKQKSTHKHNKTQTQKHNERTHTHKPTPTPTHTPNPNTQHHKITHQNLSTNNHTT